MEGSTPISGVYFEEGALLEYRALFQSLPYWTEASGLLNSVSIYRKVSYIRRTLVSNKIVDHSDVVGASPVGAAPTTSSFST